MKSSKLRTSEVKWEKFLKTNSNDVGCPRSSGQEFGHLECGRQPVDQVLRKSEDALEVRVVRSDLHQQTIFLCRYRRHRGPSFCRAVGVEGEWRTCIRLDSDNGCN